MHVLVAAARGRRQGRDASKQPCKNKFVIKRVPYSPDTKVSGANVKVTLPDGRELTETVVVEDVLVVAMGDSFMSGESNPDRPVSFSPSREMVYDPSMATTASSSPRAATRGRRPAPSALRRPTARST